MKAHCNACGPDRNHDVLHAEETSWEDSIYGFDGKDNYFLIRCGGCGQIHLRHDTYFSEDVGFEHSGWETKYYPPAVSRKQPAWLSNIGFDHIDLEDTLNEVYAALHSDSRRLAAMGIRAVLEYVMISQIGDQGSFKNNIEKFFDAGFVAPRNQELFRNVLIESGHAAMHRNHRPSKSDLSTLMDITENLIEQIFVHAEKAKRIKVPPRPKPT